MANKTSPLLRVLPAIMLIASIALTFMPANKASALNGSLFQPGRIIDDLVFTNKDAMSVVQIQAFLDVKIPACDTDGSEPYAGTTRAAYAAASLSGNATPFICLNQYYENPDATYAVTHTYVNTSGQTVNNVYNYHQNNYYQITGFNTVYNNNNPVQGINVVRPIYQNLNGAIPAGAKSAAQLIWDVAQMYNINPQVLIVLLQKEQGIATDDWAWAVQYEKATGYGCPDTAPCEAKYAGFYNQIDAAAWTFRSDMNIINAGVPNDWTFARLGRNDIDYSPNATCGTKSVYIENAATAALYKYTPYTPNDAALANLYGAGDGCSAYGNRNFWRMFNDWFGSTLTDANDPVGAFDSVMAQQGSIQINGWGFDRSTATPASIHAYVDGKWLGAYTADKPRSDVAAAYASLGISTNTGFGETIAYVEAGVHQICLWVVGDSVGANNYGLGCKTFSVTN